MLTNFKISDRVHWFLSVFNNIFPFLWLQALFWEGPGIFVDKKCLKMSKKVQFGPPFLLEDWMTLLWGGRNFSRVYFLCPFCVKNVLWDTYFLLGQADQFLYQVWELFVQEFWTGLKLYSQPLQFSKKCHENENAVFNTAKWLRILMHPTDAFKFWIFWCTRSKNVWVHLGPCWFFGPKNFFQRLTLSWSLSDNLN